MPSLRRSFYLGATYLSLREHLHDGLEMVALMGPAAPDVVERLPEAVVQHLRSPQGADLRRPRRARGWGRPLPIAAAERARDAVHLLQPGLSAGSIGLRTAGRQLGDLPLAVAVSDGLIAFSFPHDLFDGTSGWEHMTAIVQRATNTLPEGEPQPALARPLISTLRQAKLLDRMALTQARVVRRQAERDTAQPPQLSVPVRIDAERRAAGWSAVFLDAEQLARMDATRSPAQVASPYAARRSVRSMKLTEVVLAGLEAAMPAHLDYRVRVPIDLRRYAPRGARIDGPFSTSYPIGTLRGTDNSAAALTVRLAEIIKTKAPLAALASDLAGLVKGRVLHPLAKPQHSTERDGYDLTISIFPCRLPESFWAFETARVSAVMHFTPDEPSAPYIQVAEIDDTVTISLWDETGTIDPSAFEMGLLDGLAARVDAAVRAPRERA